MNSIHRTNHFEICPVIQNARKEPQTVLIEMQGKDIQTSDDYIDEAEKIFHFPSPCEGNANRYLDWIRDLTWFDDEYCRSRYVFVIYNFSIMLSKNAFTKNEIICDFEEIILPWWDGEVEKHVVDGKRKIFDVYLVD